LLHWLALFIKIFRLQRIPPLRIEDLICDLKDGVRLLALLEVLSGDKLVSVFCQAFYFIFFNNFLHFLPKNKPKPTEKGKVLRRPHFLSNANTALQFLASKKIKLVNINPADLVDGKPSIVLGLIWTIILYFQVSTF
jgi:nesprin-1